MYIYIYILQTKELLELKPDISNVIATTALPKMSKSSWLWSSMTLLNVTNSTPTMMKFSTDASSTPDQLHCRYVMVECPFPMTTAVTSDAPPAATSLSSMMTNDWFDGGGSPPSFSDENRTTARDHVENATETAYETVDDLRITAVTVTVNSDFGPSTIESTAVDSIDVWSNPFVEMTSSSTAERTPSSTAERTPSSTAEQTSISTGAESSTPSSISTAEPTESSDVTESIAISETESTTSYTHDAIAPDRHTDVDDVSSLIRVKRGTQDVSSNGTHCFRRECSSKKVTTEIPKSFQGFTEKSSE